jgi:hypothetical protein
VKARFLAAAILMTGLLLLGVESPGGAVVQVRSTPARTVKLNNEVLRFVKSKFQNNAGFPVSWNMDVQCRPPKIIKLRTTFKCTVIELPSPTSSLNEGSVNVTVSHLKATHPGYSMSFVLSVSMDRYNPPSTTTTAPPVTTTTLDAEDAFKATCQVLPFGQLVKNPAGTPVTYPAEVFQFDTVTGSNRLLAYVGSINGQWVDLAALYFPDPSMASQIVEGDVLQIWGVVSQHSWTYYNVNGGASTVPQITVRYVVVTSS